MLIFNESYKYFPPDGNLLLSIGRSLTFKVYKKYRDAIARASIIT
ncbi:hypothetical protein [Oscillatoria nigro-viridis]|nr:hypothetical protein [Oscillatoria nigro-viridis]